MLNAWHSTKFDPPQPGDEQNGGWTRDQLVEMNKRFADQLEQAFACGLESRESAAGQVKLSVSLAPRFVMPICQTAWDALLRSPASDSTVFVAR
jgi:hypothetical protein